MPFYEYQCAACQHRLEVLQKISDAPLAHCPVCNAAALKKLVSAAAFRLRGTGWYETDFKNSGKQKPDAGAEAKSETKDGSGGKGADGKSEGQSGAKSGAGAADGKSAAATKDAGGGSKSAAA